MKDEVAAAVEFLTRLVSVKNDKIPGDKVTAFRDRLSQVLLSKFKNHWFPDRPSRGQAFRCIRVNENIRRDSTLETVCRDIGINYNDLALPIEITLWIDPGEVTCRFGERKGSFCVIASFKDGNKENYVDQIDVEELEQKSLEQSRNASFDHLKQQLKKRRAAAMNNFKLIGGPYSSMGYGMNGINDYGMGSNMTYYNSPGGYYSTPNNKYGSAGGSNFTPGTSMGPSSPANMFSNGYSVSPPTRGSPFSRGGVNGSFSYSNYSNSNNTTGGASTSTATPTTSSSTTNNATGGKYSSRGLTPQFNSIQYNNSSYPSQGDRYHYFNNKSIVKA